MTAFATLATLAIRRLRHRPLRSALLGAGLALAAAMLAASLAGGLLTEDRAARRAIARLPAENRSVQAVWGGFGGLAGERFERLDPIVRDALRPVLDTAPVATLLFREARVGGRLVDLGGIEGLAGWVRLRSGRLPRPCRAAPCEVLRVAGSAESPDLPAVTIVGSGELLPAPPLPRLTLDAAERSQPIVLLAEGVKGIAALPELESMYRTYAWVIPLAAADVHAWRLADLGERVDRARVALQLASDVLDVTAPEAEVEAIRASAQVSGRRLLLVAGQAASLLLVFSLLAAIGIRADFEAAAGRLARVATRRGQPFSAAVLEIGLLAAAGVAAGWAAGTAVAIVLASALGTPAWAVVRRSALSGEGVLLAVALAVTATVVILVALRARAVRLGGFRVSPVDAAGVVALGVLGLELSRGSADPERLLGEAGSGFQLLLLPPLAAVAVAALCVRLLLPSLGWVERLFRRGAPSTRLALLWLARGPANAAAAVVFLVTSAGLALFATTYRSTLDRNLADQAAFAVPADYILREDLSRLVSIQRAAAPVRYAALGDGVQVIRASGEAARLESAQGLTVVGLPADAIPELDGWRGDFSDTGRAELARRLRPVSPTAMQGLRLPASARELILPAALHGDSVALEAAVRTPRGEIEAVDLGEHGEAASANAVRGDVPPAARGGLVVALTIDLTQLERFGGGHRETGDKGGSQGLASGVLSLGRLQFADGRGRVRTLGGYGDWISAGPISVRSANGNGASLHYRISRQETGRFRPRQPTDGRTVPVLASPRLAAAARPRGLLPLRVVGEPLAVRVVGTVRRFPTVVEGDVVVADAGTLETALNAQAPGTGVPSELWLRAAPGAAAAIRAPPFDRLEVVSQREVERELRGDPLARGTLAVLVAAALVALALAVTGVVLAVVAELRDRAGELADLEAQGLQPAAIRRQVRLRAALIAAVGVVGGAAAGGLLSMLVVGFVVLTAGADEPVPPLVLAFDWPTLLAGSLVVCLLTGTLVALVTRRAFAGQDVARGMEAAA